MHVPPNVAAFYEAELSNETPIEPDCRTWKEIDSPTMKEIEEQKKRWCSFGFRGRKLQMGTWPPWGQDEHNKGPSKPFCSSFSREAIINEVATWTVNLSRERTGLAKKEEKLDISGKPWKKWTMFYLPQPAPQVMAKILSLSLEDREHLFALRIWSGKEAIYIKRLKRLKWVLWTLIWIPVIMLTVAAVFSLEKVPFTGRWRIIMLSPEEEDAITDKLRGPGWYKTVLSMFTTLEAPAPPMVPIGDWRWTWVNGVMRRLERGVEEHCRAVHEGRPMNYPALTSGHPGADFVEPPPPAYPLQPRARASSLLHSALEGHSSGQEHLQSLGPPYALLLLENQERNAMSYGFGDGGGGGVVLYTGILDELLNRHREGQDTASVQSEQAIPPLQETPSLWTKLFGRQSTSNLIASTQHTTTQSSNPHPTEEQTLQLALVLAHEISHLLLNHHLESLSWSEIVLPSATGLGSDLIRTLLYPITWVFSPAL